MSRVIKFRAWDSETSSIYPHETLLKDGWPVGALSQPVAGMTIMQFTGLLDKNGKEIYEGDIVRPVNPPSTKKGNRAVEYVEGSFCYELKGANNKNRFSALSSGKAKLFEVIGNIYENSDLLV